MANLEELYLHAIPYGILGHAFGVKNEDFSFGYKEGTVDVLIYNNKLKIIGTVHTNDKLYNMFSSLYKNKMKSKFKKYIPEKILAYAYANISTEAYLAKLQELMTYWYSPLAGEYTEIINIVPLPYR